MSPLRCYGRRREFTSQRGCYTEPHSPNLLIVEEQAQWSDDEPSASSLCLLLLPLPAVIHISTSEFGFSYLLNHWLRRKGCCHSMDSTRRCRPASQLKLQTSLCASSNLAVFPPCPRIFRSILKPDSSLRLSSVMRIFSLNILRES